MSEIRPLARKNNIVVQILEKEILVYDLEINKAFSLNKTSAMVWQLCDGKNPVDEIAKKMSVSLQEMVSEDFVWASLEILKKENLVEAESIQNTPFEGLSRREMVRKIGVASMIALPMISSLVAPSSVSAASCGFNLQQTGCTADFQCCSPATTCTNEVGNPRRCCVGPGDNQNGQSAPSVVISGQTCATLSTSIADSDCDSMSGAPCCSGNARYWATHPTACADIAPSPTVRVRCICTA